MPRGSQSRGAPRRILAGGTWREWSLAERRRARRLDGDASTGPGRNRPPYPIPEGNASCRRNRSRRSTSRRKLLVSAPVSPPVRASGAGGAAPPQACRATAPGKLTGNTSRQGRNVSIQGLGTGKPVRLQPRCHCRRSLGRPEVLADTATGSRMTAAATAVEPAMAGNDMDTTRHLAPCLPLDINGRDPVAIRRAAARARYTAAWKNEWPRRCGGRVRKDGKAETNPGGCRCPPGVCASRRRAGDRSQFFRT